MGNVKDTFGDFKSGDKCVLIMFAYSCTFYKFNFGSVYEYLDYYGGNMVQILTNAGGIMFKALVEKPIKKDFGVALTQSVYLVKRDAWALRKVLKFYYHKYFPNDVPDKFKLSWYREYKRALKRIKTKIKYEGI